MERSLILVKPDALQRGLIGEIISRFEDRGLKIIGLKMMSVSQALAKEHYKEHTDKPFFTSLVDYITGCPVIAMVVQGPGAIDMARTTIGSTNPTTAVPGSIRGDLAISIGRNLVHGSDSTASAQREISLFFKDEELFDYSRTADQWILET